TLHGRRGDGAERGDPRQMPGRAARLRRRRRNRAAVARLRTGDGGASHAVRGGAGALGDGAGHGRGSGRRGFGHASTDGSRRCDQRRARRAGRHRAQAPGAKGVARMTPLERKLVATLRKYTTDLTARGILRRAQERRSETNDNEASFEEAVLYGARLFVEEPERSVLLAELREVFNDALPLPDAIKLQ